MRRRGTTNLMASERTEAEMAILRTLKKAGRVPKAAIHSHLKRFTFVQLTEAMSNLSDENMIFGSSSGWTLSRKGERYLKDLP